jgi:hypothetical protein
MRRYTVKTFGRLGLAVGLALILTACGAAGAGVRATVDHRGETND